MYCLLIRQGDLDNSQLIPNLTSKLGGCAYDSQIVVTLLLGRFYARRSFAVKLRNTKYSVHTLSTTPPIAHVFLRGFVSY